MGGGLLRNWPCVCVWCVDLMNGHGAACLPQLFFLRLLLLPLLLNNNRIFDSREQ